MIGNPMTRDDEFAYAQSAAAQAEKSTAAQADVSTTFNNRSLERYALVSCHVPKLTYETLTEHAKALDQPASELARQIVIEWAMLQRAGAHPTPAACQPDEPPQWRKTHPWYCHTCHRRVSGWEWHSHEPCGRPAEMRCTGHTVTVAVSCNVD